MMHDTEQDPGMSATRLLERGFDAVNRLSHEVVAELTGDELSERLDAEANPIGWLVWHVARVQDQEISAFGGRPELWRTDGWDARFDLAGTTSTGEGHSSADVARVPARDAALLLAYADTVHARVTAILRSLDAAGLAAPASDRSDLAKGELLAQILSAVTQHCGQAAYVRGILLRRRIAGAG